MSALPYYSCAFYQCKAHTRLRVPRASGVPHTLQGGESFMHDSGVSRKDCPSGGMDPEEAKQIAKCIVAALTDAGLEIVPASRNSCDR